MKRVGVLGGGQLGLMLGQAACCLGIEILFLDPDQSCPASKVGQIVLGDPKDYQDVIMFGKQVDVLTTEIEDVNVLALQHLEEDGKSVQPRSTTLGLIQDKFVQKTHFEKFGLKQCTFGEIEDVKEFKLPLLVKSKRHGYDGRGNHKITDINQFEYSDSHYIEELVPHVAELAVMVVRSLGGQIETYPVVDTFQTDGICTKVVAPSLQKNKWLVEQAERLATEAVSCLTGAGVFGVEMFVLDTGELLLNEVAPRPHNSGHYTIEACWTSQFEQHLRAILGLPLGKCGFKVVEVATMYNLIGVDIYICNPPHPISTPPYQGKLIEQILSIPRATLHWYGKKQVRSKRKMGHVTVLGPLSKHLVFCNNL